MPQETELKLAVRAQDLPLLLAHPLLSAQAPLREQLVNTYYDTASLDLMRQRIAVRERLQGGRTLLTVKTAGHSVGGLSRRLEWEGPTEPGRFDFRALVDDEALAHQLCGLAADLLPVFRTDFERRRWWLELEGAQVEVALDEGWISSRTPTSQAQEAILELELELKRGPETALLALAQALSQPVGGPAPLSLRPSDRSKAERGYALFLSGADVRHQRPAASPKDR